MNGRLRHLKTRIKDSRFYDPRIVREYYFLRDHARYLWRALAHRNRWRRILDDRFTLLGFDITDVCNSRCCYCAYWFTKPKGFMEMSLYEKGVREFSEMGGGTIGFSLLTGEPLLDPLLMKRIEFAARFDNITDVTFDTNGILLQKADIREALLELSSKIRITINISLPGFDKAMFERVYGVPWNDAILHGVSDLLQRNRTLSAPLVITLALQPDGGGILSERNYLTYIAPYIDPDHVLLDSRVRDNWCGLITESHLTGDMVLRRKSLLHGIPCGYLLDRHLDILMNGDVRLCGCRYGAEGKYDELVIGNINEKSLSEIWSGSEMRRLCERFPSSDAPKVCRDCSIYTPAG
jgi:radical SAM protein with 4Fe4S-binding SPASM domain